MKVAYPNIDERTIPSQYNTDKWIKCLKFMYNCIHNGEDRKSVLQKLSNNFDQKEFDRFLKWVRFYEEGNHLRYKIATKSLQFLDFLSKDRNNTEVFVEKENTSYKDTIEDMRDKMLSRIKALQKLIESKEGRKFFSEELPIFINVVNMLRQKILTYNPQKISTAKKTYDDFVYREVNVLRKNGCNNAADYLEKFAQMPSATPPPIPTQGIGTAQDIPTTPPTQSNPLPNNIVNPTAPPPEPKSEISSSPTDSPMPNSKGIDKFINNLSTSNISSKEDLNATDDLYVEDEELVSLGQAVRTTNTSMEKINEIINKPLPTTTIDDAITLLEEIAIVHKVRQIPRMLSSVDMILNQHGLASMFPTLAESQNKSLEANNYILSRIEEIISKLKGVAEKPNIDLKESNKNISPESQSIRNNIEEENLKEEKKKQLKKELEYQQISEKETPEIEIIDEQVEPPKVQSKVQPKVPITPPQPKVV